MTYKQKRPDINRTLKTLLNNGVTQRGAARILRCSKNTVDRRLVWLSDHTSENPLLSYDIIYIDEMESIEQTKLKPLTIPLAVSNTYEILATSVGKIPAKGHLSKISIKKYGFRENEKIKALTELFDSLKSRLKATPKIIRTDGAPIYLKLAKKYFPNAQHEIYPSREVHSKKKEMVYLNKKKPFDPLFPINQRCAKLRADIRRLTRRSWCTTKKPDNLARHLKLYRSLQ